MIGMAMKIARRILIFKRKKNLSLPTNNENRDIHDIWTSLYLRGRGRGALLQESRRLRYSVKSAFTGCRHCQPFSRDDAWERAEGVLIARRSLNRAGWLSVLRRQGWRNRQWKMCGFLIADVFQLSIVRQGSSQFLILILFHRPVIIIIVIVVVVVVARTSRGRWPFSISREAEFFPRVITTIYTIFKISRK